MKNGDVAERRRITWDDFIKMVEDKIERPPLNHYKFMHKFGEKHE